MYVVLLISLLPTLQIQVMILETHKQEPLVQGWQIQLLQEWHTLMCILIFLKA